MQGSCECSLQVIGLIQLEIKPKSTAPEARSHRWPSGNSVCLVSYRLGFDSELGLTSDFKVGIHSNVENKPASVLVVPLGWALSGIMLTKVLC